ncbi:YceI family protein [Balneolaceae bacterium YR4-1]|uniref:YceI family protein n=1 Tax=Halalkalibaculum roseum TaxID=2709311 RepID=A0A6M1TBM2_9BACT|nr:YceI family protein [Halalkalibaculum roseum]NGP77503.1 YceI family protein [Halalkalibaculum roseum]
MKKVTNTLLTTLIVLLASVTAWAQSPSFTLDEANSSIVITGTSTIHDWEADVEEMSTEISLAPQMMTQDSMANPVQSFSLTVPVESIESGKGGMNRKIYGALKEDKHPNIMFNFSSATLADTVQTPDSFKLNVTGNLNIAGKVQEVTFPVTGTKVGENGYRFEGSYGLNMKDYDVDPPSAVFGTIKSGEEVEITFNVMFTATQS